MTGGNDDIPFPDDEPVGREPGSDDDEPIGEGGAPPLSFYQLPDEEEPPLPEERGDDPADSHYAEQA